jgi:hypothetical protein
MEVTVKTAASYAVIGLVMGAPLGVLLSILTRNPVLGMAGPGIGLVIGASLDAKAKGEKPDA